MLSRKSQDQDPIQLPDTWKSNVEELLISIYKDDCEKTGKVFKVFGETYPDEVAIAISLLKQDDELAIPVTYTISADLKKGENAEKLLETLVDSVGMFFDNFFSSSEDWDEYNARWQEIEFRTIKLFYKVTRENLELTSLADQLLSKFSEE